MTIRSRPTSAAIDRIAGWIEARSALMRSICAVTPRRARCAANAAEDTSGLGSSSLRQITVTACARARKGAASRTARAATRLPSHAMPTRLGIIRTLMRVGNEKNRPARLKQDCLRHGIVEGAGLGLGLQHDCQIVEPRHRADGLGSFGRYFCQRLQAIANSCIPGFGFENSKRSFGPRQCTFTF